MAYKYLGYTGERRRSAVLADAWEVVVTRHNGRRFGVFATWAAAKRAIADAALPAGLLVRVESDGDGSLVVERATGRIVRREPSSALLGVERFKPETLPAGDVADLGDVGYWNTLGYVGAPVDDDASERFEHDVCPKCGAESQPAEDVPDQSFRDCPNCCHQWFEDLENPPHRSLKAWSNRPRR
jgi:hypothetical protein